MGLQPQRTEEQKEGDQPTLGQVDHSLPFICRAEIHTHLRNVNLGPYQLRRARTKSDHVPFKDQELLRCVNGDHALFDPAGFETSKVGFLGRPVNAEFQPLSAAVGDTQTQDVGQ